jgi:anti-sigma factor RsiW
MSQKLEERIDAYLEGALPPDEAGRFEQELLDPAVAGLFAEALRLREMLASAPPDRPPEELIELIESTLEVERVEESEPAPRFGRARAALSGMSWVYRGPAMAVVPGGREALSGMSTIRYALGPLNRPAKPKKPSSKKRSRAAKTAEPLWRRILWRKK